jgi:hypothetical protein
MLSLYVPPPAPGPNFMHFLKPVSGNGLPFLERHIMKNIPGGHNLFVPDQVSKTEVIASFAYTVINASYFPVPSRDVTLLQGLT